MVYNVHVYVFTKYYAMCETLGRIYPVHNLWAYETSETFSVSTIQWWNRLRVIVIYILSQQNYLVIKKYFPY